MMKDGATCKQKLEQRIGVQAKRRSESQKMGRVWVNIKLTSFEVPTCIVDHSVERLLG